MTKTVMTFHWLRIFAVMAPVPLLWLMLVVSPLRLALLMIVLLVAASIVAGALRIGRSTRSMADVIHDVDVEAVPIRVHPQSAVSTPRRHR